jgi:hypothetical protein
MQSAPDSLTLPRLSRIASLGFTAQFLHRYNLIYNLLASFALSHRVCEEAIE